MILYILYNKLSDKYYIGITDNLERRLKEHNGNQKHFTGKTKGNWELKYFKNYEIKNEALLEEKRLKKARNRKYLEWYIENSGR